MNMKLKFKTLITYLESKKYLIHKIFNNIIAYLFVYLIGDIFLLTIAVININNLYSKILNNLIINGRDFLPLNKIIELNHAIALGNIVFSLFDVLLLVTWAIVTGILSQIIKIVFDIVFIYICNNNSTKTLYNKYIIEKNTNPKLSKKLGTASTLLLIGAVFVSIYAFHKDLGVNFLLKSIIYYFYIAIPIMYVVEYFYTLKDIKKENVGFEKQYINVISNKRRLLDILFILLFIGFLIKIVIPELKNIYDLEKNIILIKIDFLDKYNSVKEVFKNNNIETEFNNIYGNYDQILNNISASRIFITNIPNFNFLIIEDGFYILGGIIALSESIGIIILSSYNKKAQKRIIKKLLIDIEKSIIITGVIILLIGFLFKRGSIKDVFNYNTVYVLSIMFIINQIIE